MKPSHPANPIQSAPTHYSPSVPMSVYRELAAELRANKAVIDSLNSRNQQLLEQNQRLKQEIHNVVQATLNLGQFAGVARQAAQEEFPSAIAPDTLAKLVRAQGEARKVVPSEPLPVHDVKQTAYTQPATDYRELLRTPQAPAASHPAGHPTVSSPPAPQPAAQKRTPRPIQMATPQTATPQAKSASAPKRKVARPAVAKPKARSAAPAQQQRSNVIPSANKALPKLFTEQVGEHRSTALESTEDKEISGIWLVLSIILIVVTAFGAGFLIMKPLLNDR
ncbi:MAG: hypothetical protein AAFU71_19375 [Cyanobacteria bacterium J06632_22]